jgi:hypothetical protein
VVYLGGPVNVNEQCGVLVPPNDTPCARSLTCKTHSMGAKRSVPGRSAPYDVLLSVKTHIQNTDDSHFSNMLNQLILLVLCFDGYLKKSYKFKMIENIEMNGKRRTIRTGVIGR